MSRNRARLVTVLWRRWSQDDDYLFPDRRSFIIGDHLLAANDPPQEAEKPLGRPKVPTAAVFNVLTTRVNVMAACKPST